MTLEDKIRYAKEEEEPIKELVFENETIANLDCSKIDFKLVRFQNCKFVECDFTGAYFVDTNFENCDFSNSRLLDIYLKNCKIKSCKADGSSFIDAKLKDTVIDTSFFRYTNFTSSSWDNCEIIDSDFQEAFLSEVKFKKINLFRVNLSGADFFNTPLKNIDLSDCSIDGIAMSNTCTELKGARVSVVQTVEIAKILGIRIVERG